MKVSTMDGLRIILSCAPRVLAQPPRVPLLLTDAPEHQEEDEEED